MLNEGSYQFADKLKQKTLVLFQAERRGSIKGMTAEEARAALTPQQVDGKSMDQLLDHYNQ